MYSAVPQDRVLVVDTMSRRVRRELLIFTGMLILALPNLPGAIYTTLGSMSAFDADDRFCLTVVMMMGFVLIVIALVIILERPDLRRDIGIPVLVMGLATIAFTDLFPLVQSVKHMIAYAQYSF